MVTTSEPGTTSACVCAWWHSIVYCSHKCTLVITDWQYKFCSYTTAIDCIQAMHWVSIQQGEKTDTNVANSGLIYHEQTHYYYYSCLYRQLLNWV